MSKKEELILKTVKEIVVKFIEVGNISPTSFDKHFRNIYQTIKSAADPDPGGAGIDTRSGDEKNA